MRLSFSLQAFCLFLLLATMTSCEELTLDQQLKVSIIKYDFKAMSRIHPKTDKERAMLQLGTALFGDMDLSIPQVKSCFHCHQPLSGTTNMVPFSPGIGKKYPKAIRDDNYPNAFVPYWQQRESILSKRKSPSLLNVGHREHTSLFTDGRVYLDRKTNKIMTPDKNLNNRAPGYEKIANTLDSITAAQVLFPIVDMYEMRGDKRKYRPDLKSNLDVWNEVASRIKANPNYKELIEKAFPGEEVNMGHFANALATFQRIVFQVTETPWDRYLRGDLNALNDQQKRGAIVFSEKASCVRCHSGQHLSDFSFQNTLVPHVTQNIYGQGIDYGRYDKTKDKKDKFKFRVPSLRFLTKREPFFHNGTARTVEEVIDHYEDPKENFMNYNITAMNDYYFQWGIEFTKDFILLDDKDDMHTALRNVSPRLKMKLELTSEEREDLISFLRGGLSGTPIVSVNNLPREFGVRASGTEETAFEITQDVLDLVSPYMNRNEGFWVVPGPHTFYCYPEINNCNK